MAGSGSESRRAVERGKEKGEGKPEGGKLPPVVGRRAGKRGIRLGRTDGYGGQLTKRRNEANSGAPDKDARSGERQTGNENGHPNPEQAGERQRLGSHRVKGRSVRESFSCLCFRRVTRLNLTTPSSATAERGAVAARVRRRRRQQT